MSRLLAYEAFSFNQPRSISAPVAPTSPITQPEAPTVICCPVGPEANTITTAMEPIPVRR